MIETSICSIAKARSRLRSGEPQTVKHEESFEEQVARARSELAQYGITSEQRAAYVPIINFILYNGIHPVGYDREGHNGIGFNNISPFDKMLQLLPNLIRGRETRFNTIAKREDAWRFYLGMPQEYDTFGISDYRPAKSTENKYYYKINGFSPESLLDPRVSLDRQIQNGGKLIMQDDDFNVMGNFTLGRGSDEKGDYLSYYDRWDLDKIPLERRGIFGKPFEIYDRQYIKNSEIPRLDLTLFNFLLTQTGNISP